MRRLRRILWNAVTVLSLLMCVVTVVLWVQSYWGGLTLELCHVAEGEVMVEGKGGSLGVVHRVSLTPPPEAVSMVWVKSRRVARWSWKDFGIGHGEDVPRVNRFAEGTPGFVYGYARMTYLIAPAWAAVGLFALLPMARLLRLVRRAWWSSHAAGPRCSSCGYDLRATPERCPECGAVPEGVKV